MDKKLEVIRLSQYGYLIVSSGERQDAVISAYQLMLEIVSGMHEKVLIMSNAKVNYDSKKS